MIANTLEKVLKTQAGSIDRPYKEVKEMTSTRKNNRREKVGVTFSFVVYAGIYPPEPAVAPPQTLIA